ncbi:hypothetical protein BKA69DRAFT_1062270 [Paraphysoderma sedebokerense]|nr:hypothetical protein BKA69DRAFT_1062270 [Paraphysoderma sedebokerense]
MLHLANRFVWLFVVLGSLIVCNFTVGDEFSDILSGTKTRRSLLLQNTVLESKTIHPGLSLENAPSISISGSAKSCPLQTLRESGEILHRNSQAARLRRRLSQDDEIQSSLPHQFKLTSPLDLSVDYTYCYQLIGYHGTCTRKNAQSIEKAILPQPLGPGRDLQLGEGFYVTSDPFIGYSLGSKSCNDNGHKTEPALCAVYIDREVFNSLSKLFVPRSMVRDSSDKSKGLWWSAGTVNRAEWQRKYETKPENAILFSHIHNVEHELNLPSVGIDFFQAKLPNELLLMNRVKAKCVMKDDLELDDETYMLDYPNLFLQWNTKVWGDKISQENSERGGKDGKESRGSSSRLQTEEREENPRKRQRTSN